MVFQKPSHSAKMEISLMHFFERWKERTNLKYDKMNIRYVSWMNTKYWQIQ